MLLLASVVVDGGVVPEGLCPGPPETKSMRDSSDEGLDPWLDPFPGLEPPPSPELLSGLEGLFPGLDPSPTPPEELDSPDGLDPGVPEPGLEPTFCPMMEVLPLSRRLPEI